MKRILPIAVFVASAALAQNPAYAPDRRADEGEGPFQRLIVRGATVVDGTCAPPVGPVDIVIEGNRIRESRSGGYPTLPIKAEGRRKDTTKEIDGSNQWVLQRFVELHGHVGG